MAQVQGLSAPPYDALSPYTHNHMYNSWAFLNHVNPYLLHTKHWALGLEPVKVYILVTGNLKFQVPIGGLRKRTSVKASSAKRLIHISPRGLQQCSLEELPKIGESVIQCL